MTYCTHELAAMIRVHPETLRRWETGRHRPGKRQAARLREFVERWQPKLANVG